MVVDVSLWVVVCLVEAGTVVFVVGVFSLGGVCEAYCLVLPPGFCVVLYEGVVSCLCRLTLIRNILEITKRQNSV